MSTLKKKARVLCDFSDRPNPANGRACGNEAIGFVSGNPGIYYFCQDCFDATNQMLVTKFKSKPQEWAYRYEKELARSVK